MASFLDNDKQVIAVWIDLFGSPDQEMRDNINEFLEEAEGTCSNRFTAPKVLPHF